jgi:peptidoglycan/xylan/chitin deacetylase (PgdA/CDA1 family)
MDPITLAIEGKGTFNFLRRGTRILRRYGITPDKLDRGLHQFAGILERFACSATFPITAVALQRNPLVISKYHSQGIEFAVHGHRHLDYSQLSPAEQSAELTSAEAAFAQAGIEAQGFRSPYLRWNAATLAALQQHGFSYDSSQGLAWDIPRGDGTRDYLYALEFYRALPARDHPSLPRLQDDLVRIPYSLPDDEALTERLALNSPDEGIAVWGNILQQSYDLGEMFTLGLHPERIAMCREPLVATLDTAQALSPPVWIARLDEIATWWRARSRTIVEITDVGDCRLRISVNGGPPGVTVLARGVHVEAPTLPWADGYHRVDALSFTTRTNIQPVIGVTPQSSDRLISFLRQQGYLVDKTAESHNYSLYLDQVDLAARDERTLLNRLESHTGPLMRLGRWPNGARSALSVTGDIDALTLWDYAWRFLGR